MENEICEDFNRWEYDIFNCPHVSVITQEEVDLMIRFLEETPVEEQYADEVPYHYDWLNYPYLKICFADREGIELDEFYQTYVLCIMDDNGIPPWYDFYDEFMYTKHLLGLTDVKFPNEIRYTRLHAQFLRDEKKKKEIAEGISQEPFRKSDPRPYLGLGMDHNKIFTDIVNNFESPITRKNFENYAAVEIAPNSEEEDLREEVDNVIDELKNIREAVPIIEHENWKQGLIISYRKYKYQKTIDAIPYAYQDYLTRIETKIPFPAPIQPFNDASLLQTKQNILAGRKLAGEPMDFNF